MGSCDRNNRLGSHKLTDITGCAGWQVQPTSPGIGTHCLTKPDSTTKFGEDVTSEARKRPLNPKIAAIIKTSSLAKSYSPTYTFDGMIWKVLISERREETRETLVVIITPYKSLLIGIDSLQIVTPSCADAPANVELAAWSASMRALEFRHPLQPC